MEAGFTILIGAVVVFATLLRLRMGQRNQKWEWEEHTKYNRQLIESVTQLDRGTWSERDLILELLKSGFNSGALFHDLYLKKYNGQHTQIDLVLATKVGLIVFEVKDYGGWIFGKGNQNQWTQVELRKQSKQFEKLPMFSVIVFYGNCNLRDISFIPSGTYVTTARRVLDVVDTIINNNPPANYTDKHEVIRILATAVQNGAEWESRKHHAESVKDMLGKDRVFD